jgi:hypothetical protein
LNGTISLGEVFSKIYFDIRVKNPLIASDISALGKGDMWVLKNCLLNAREIQVSVGNVVILENVTIFAKSNQEKTASNLTSGLVPFV